MDNPPKRYYCKDAARVLGVCTETVRRWDKAGYITSYRTPSNLRYFDPEEIDTLLAKGRVPKKGEYMSLEEFERVKENMKKLLIKIKSDEVLSPEQRESIFYYLEEFLHLMCTNSEVRNDYFVD